LRLAMLAAFPDELRPAAMPAPVHRLIVRAMAPQGRRLRSRYAARALSNHRRNRFPRRLPARPGPG
jgi:hypothetical protein